MQHGAAIAIRITLCITALSACLARDVHADQVGIDKVRLFETEIGHYVLEVDTSARLAAAYREPVLPERLELTDCQRDRQAGYLVLRYLFRSRGEPLTVGDELLLPWGRSGASITAQWSDGSVHQNLFLRDFEGIRVRIEMLKPWRPSATQLARCYVGAGVAHAAFGWNHWLLVAAAGLLASGWWRIGLILLFAGGQAISLVLTDLGVLVIPADTAEACLILVALLIARSSWLSNEHWPRFTLVMLILGLLHGVARAKTLTQSGVSEDHLVQTLFLFNLGVDALQLVAATAACVIAVIVGRVKAAGVINNVVSAVLGSAAFALLLIAVTGGHSSSHLEFAMQQADRPFEMPAAEMAFPETGSRPQPALAQEPVAAFLTLEPYETRLEVLVRLAQATDWIELPSDQTTIQVDQQESIKQQLIERIGNHTGVSIDGNRIPPSLLRADFVTAESNGIFSRPSPVTEQIEGAIVGVTFVYDTRELPSEVRLDWNLFAVQIQSVTATTIDPFGGRKQELSPDASELTWKNRWMGYRPPGIKPVEVTEPKFPLLSVLFAALAGLMYWILKRSEHQRSAATVRILFLAAAFIAYPFVRVSMGTTFAAAWQPTPQEASGILDRLLMNVYRAYDIRDEEAIYDRLAFTISGEQLAEIYLDTRRSLELENRGGARAKVDQVDVLEVHGVDDAGDEQLAVDLTWTVSGSVSHFGHTHYRRNRYRAVVTIAPDDGYWKIQSVEIGEQQRVL